MLVGGAERGAAPCHQGARCVTGNGQVRGLDLGGCWQGAGLA
jgi:hypothetical protein